MILKGPEITVVKEMTFDAAHYLPEYEGPCQRLHGHTYKLQVGVKGKVNPKTGMVCDFVVVKSIMKQLVDLVDHQCLNDVKQGSFPNHMPTAELMIVWFATMLMDRLSLEFRDDSVYPAFVRLWETPTSYAEIII